ncbi:porin family protein [Chryseobacterium sp.]|uniref:porin family protein n=1 Tax=Chryseobacterium sp. TaxID=1871047 RepID=UPI0025BF1660|nr:porin family protein [Chryseobacterium sp.]MBV8327402.1 PorT family protein [Chryseobacterium sp.]
MKKLFAGLAVAGSLFMNAQEKAQSSSPITFGVKAGFNASTLSRTNDHDGDFQDDEDKMKAGFHAGVFVNIPVAQKFSIQPELLFTQLGAKTEERFSYTYNNTTYRKNADYKTNLNYLVLPVVVQYNILPQLYVEAGPEFGLLLGGKSKGDETQSSKTGSVVVTTTESFSEKLPMDFYNRFNFGIGMGAGYYFTQNFAVTARFTAGITNILKNADDGYKVRNNALQIGVAYKFK